MKVSRHAAKLSADEIFALISSRLRTMEDAYNIRRTLNSPEDAHTSHHNVRAIGTDPSSPYADSDMGGQFSDNSEKNAPPREKKQHFKGRQGNGRYRPPRGNPNRPP